MICVLACTRANTEVGRWEQNLRLHCQSKTEKHEGKKKNPTTQKKQNHIWLMQQNISDSLVDWREERLKREVGREDGRGNRECTFCIHHGLWLGWWARELGLWLQQGALSLSLVRFLHYHLSFVRGRDSPYYSFIDFPSTSVAVCRCSVSHTAISMAQR